MLSKIQGRFFSMNINQIRKTRILIIYKYLHFQ